MAIDVVHHGMAIDVQHANQLHVHQCSTALLQSGQVEGGAGGAAAGGGFITTKLTSVAATSRGQDAIAQHRRARTLCLARLP